MKVLVTGASGFIGSYLVQSLLQLGATVRVLTRRAPAACRWPEKVDVFQGDVRDEVAMKRAASDVDAIFHLAALVHETETVCTSIHEYNAVNVEGTRNLLHGAITGGVRRFVFFSSVKAMGERTEGCYDESAPAKPETQYGRSKLEAERVVLEWARSECVHAACLRFPLVYGTGQKGNLGQLIKAIDLGIFPPLPEFGNQRSMIHVRDVIEAALLAAIHPTANGRCYLVTDGCPYSTRALYDLICLGLEKKVPKWHMPVWALNAMARIGDAIGRVRGRRFLFDSDALEKLIGSAWFSSEKISRELGYRPTLTFEEALPELIAWYRKSQA